MSDQIGMERAAPTGRRSWITGRVVMGVIAIWVGLLWTLDNFNVLESEPILDWWPMAVIAVGLAKLTGIATRRHVVWGLTFVAVGMWLLLGSLDVLEVRVWQLWPIALVAVGLHLVSRAYSPRRPDGTADDPSNSVTIFSMWGSVVRKVTSQAFRGGDITTVMAGAELDLTHARAVAGGAVLDVFMWWAGVTVTVPDDWTVVSEATVLMGGIEDKTQLKPADQRNTLTIRGLVVMAGIELKSRAA